MRRSAENGVRMALASRVDLLFRYVDLHRRRPHLADLC
jgi:hypothetical protein